MTTDKTVIDASKKSSITVVSIAMMFVILGCWLLSVDKETLEIPNISFILIYIAGGFSVLFFGLCAAAGVFRLLSKKPVFELNSDGINIFTAGPSVLIPWGEIKGFSVYELHNQKFLVVNLYNPESHINTGGKFRQRLAQASYNMCGSPFSISANSTNFNIQELSDICEKYLSLYGTQPQATSDL